MSDTDGVFWRLRAEEWERDLAAAQQRAERAEREAIQAHECATHADARLLACETPDPADPDDLVRCGYGRGAWERTA